MDIFARLLFGHFLADFTLQTNFLAEWKRHSFRGLLVHVAIHPICYLALTLPLVNHTWLALGSVKLNGWMIILILTVLHFAEDWFRITMVNKNYLPDNTFFYLWDQIVHILVLILLCPVRTQPLTHIWPVLGTLFVIVTHFATVTVWFIEKDIYGRSYPETEEKYISILQRLVVWLAFFLPHPLWIFLVLFFVVSFGRHIWRRRFDFSWTSVILGNALALGAGFVTRFGLQFHF